MGHYTKIYGYIESHRKHTEHNQSILDAFEFDEVYPFANGFGRFIGSTRGKWLVASYATIVRHDDEETWLDWILRFEELLMLMDGYFAEVRFQSDRQGSAYIRRYSGFGDETEVSAIWIREPPSEPAVAGAINFSEDLDVPVEESS